MQKSIDYQFLLGKFMDMVGSEEGTCFYGQWKYYFSEEEIKALNEAEQEYISYQYEFDGV